MYDLISYIEYIRVCRCLIGIINCFKYFKSIGVIMAVNHSFRIRCRYESPPQIIIFEF